MTRFSALFVRYLFDQVGAAMRRNLRVMMHEGELFVGTAFLLFGTLNFEVGRYCDGNTAEYLSCTRPAVYYYFDMFDKIFILLGIFLILAWLLQRSRA